MRKCTKCGIEKHPREFFLRDKSTGRLHAQCKKCYQEHRVSYHKMHYEKYKEAYRDRARIRRFRVKSEIQAKMTAYLEDKRCEECGENDPRVLDFDHIDPKQKSFGIARAISNGVSWEMIQSEIEKCRILCANCHRKHTAAQRGWYRLPKEKIGGADQD